MDTSLVFRAVAISLFPPSVYGHRTIIVAIGDVPFSTLSETYNADVAKVEASTRFVLGGDSCTRTETKEREDELRLAIVVADKWSENELAAATEIARAKVGARGVISALLPSVVKPSLRVVEQNSMLGAPTALYNFSEARAIVGVRSHREYVEGLHSSADFAHRIERCQAFLPESSAEGTHFSLSGANSDSACTSGYICAVWGDIGGLARETAYKMHDLKEPLLVTTLALEGTLTTRASSAEKYASALERENDLLIRELALARAEIGVLAGYGSALTAKKTRMLSFFGRGVRSAIRRLRFMAG